MAAMEVRAILEFLGVVSEAGIELVFQKLIILCQKYESYVPRRYFENNSHGERKNDRSERKLEKK